MMILAIGLLLFAGPHFYSSFMPASRNQLQTKMGEGAYKGLYSALSLLGLILVGYAYWVARESGDMLYMPSGNMRHATAGLATLSMILIAASHGKGYIRAFVKQPFSIGIALWSIGHLLSVGKWTVDVMWIVLLAIAVVDIVLSAMRGKVKTFEPRIRSDIIAVGLGLALTAIFALWFHPYVLGVQVGNRPMQFLSQNG